MASHRRSRIGGRSSRPVDTLALGLGLGVAFALAGAGCIGQDLASLSAAEEEYERCVEAHSETHPECEALREQVIAEQRRYEQNARRAWACDPASEECPTPR